MHDDAWEIINGIIILSAVALLSIEIVIGKLIGKLT